MTLLGVNIDHIATLRNARGGHHPDPVEGALIAEDYGADGITAHLREDRRHIRDDDMRRLKDNIETRLNMEMAATQEMLGIALEIRPYMVTIVPERREELTTEGGLDVAGQIESLKPYVHSLTDSGIWVSLFVDADPKQIEASRAVGAPMIEIHTGAYCYAFEKGGEEAAAPYLGAMREAALHCHGLNIKLNAGHGLTIDNVLPVAQLPGMIELNIGHSIMGRAMMIGLGEAILEMKSAIAGETYDPLV